MPPTVKTTRALSTSTTRSAGAPPARVTTATQALSPEPPLFAGVLLRPGRYLLRNVHVSVPLTGWAQEPVTGAVHVAWQGDRLVETWVMLSSYKPVNGASGDRVVLTAVPAPSAEPLPAFMTWLGTQHDTAGAVTATWSYGASDVYILPPPNPFAQLMPGSTELQVEILGLGLGGQLGGAVGAVALPPVAGPVPNWRQLSYAELWHVLPGTSPLSPGQSVLLNPCPPDPSVLMGSLCRSWQVQYASLSGESFVNLSPEAPPALLGGEG